MPAEGKSVRRKGAKRIETAEILKEAKKRGRPVEEVLYGRMKRNPYVYGATSDWPEIRPITIAVMRELKNYLPYQEIHDMVLYVIELYDTQVISVLRRYGDVHRLALFVNQMIESSLAVPAYEAALLREYKLAPTNRILLRGIVLRRIADPEVLNIFTADSSDFFRAENYCAKRFLEGILPGVSVEAANAPAAALEQ